MSWPTRPSWPPATDRPRTRRLDRESRPSATVARVTAGSGDRPGCPDADRGPAATGRLGADAARPDRARPGDTVGPGARSIPVSPRRLGPRSAASRAGGGCGSWRPSAAGLALVAAAVGSLYSPLVVASPRPDHHRGPGRTRAEVLSVTGLASTGGRSSSRYRQPGRPPRRGRRPSAGPGSAVLADYGRVRVTPGHRGGGGPAVGEPRPQPVWATVDATGPGPGERGRPAARPAGGRGARPGSGSRPVAPGSAGPGEPASTGARTAPADRSLVDLAAPPDSPPCQPVPPPPWRSRRPCPRRCGPVLSVRVGPGAS